MRAGISFSGITRMSRASAYVIAGSLFLVSALFTATQPVKDVDAWWIAAAGRDILRNGHVPTTNLYSFADGSWPWVMHEWLFGPLYATGAHALGPSFFALFGLVVVSAGFACILHGTVQPARHPVGGLALAVVALMCFGKRFLSPRPSGVALVFAIVMLALGSRKEFRWRHAALAVLLEWVWANAHGTFPLGVVLLVFGAALTKTDVARRLGTAAAAAAVTLVNPYGFGLHRLVLGYLRPGTNDTFALIHEQIAEFAPIWGNFGNVLGPPELLGIALVVPLTVVALLRPQHRLRGLFCASLALLAARHVREVEQFGVLTSIVLAPLVDDLLDRTSPAVPSPGRKAGPLFATLPVFALALAAHVVVRAQRSADAWLAPNIGGPAFPGIVAAMPDRARAFVPFESTGLLLWLGAPRGIQTLADARNDCYRRAVADAQTRLEGGDLGREEAEAILDRWGVEQIAVPRSRQLASILEPSLVWTVKVREADWLLLGRR